LTIRLAELESGRQVAVEVRGPQARTADEVEHLRAEVRVWASEQLRRAGFLKLRAEAERRLREAVDLLERHYAVLTDADRMPLVRMMDRLRDHMTAGEEAVLRQSLREFDLAVEGLTQYLSQHGKFYAASQARPTSFMRIELD
jgi:hypothetical protein